jgi:hypothetical protein
MIEEDVIRMLVPKVKDRIDQETGKPYTFEQIV